MLAVPTSRLDYLLHMYFKILKNYNEIRSIKIKTKIMEECPVAHDVEVYVSINWILNIEGEVQSIWDLSISGLQKYKGNDSLEVRRGGQKNLVGS